MQQEERAVNQIYSSIIALKPEEDEIDAKIYKRLITMPILKKPNQD